MGRCIVNEHLSIGTSGRWPLFEALWKFASHFPLFSPALPRAGLSSDSDSESESLRPSLTTVRVGLALVSVV